MIVGDNTVSTSRSFCQLHCFHIEFTQEFAASPTMSSYRTRNVNFNVRVQYCSRIRPRSWIELDNLTLVFLKTTSSNSTTNSAAFLDRTRHVIGSNVLINRQLYHRISATFLASYCKYRITQLPLC